MPLDARALLPTRIVMDLFGPLINIAAIGQFKVADPRYRSEDEIAELLNNANPEGTWTAQKVLDATHSALQSWGRFPGLVDQEILQLLLEATRRGAQVIIVSTAPQENLITAAQRALRLATEEHFRRHSEDYGTFQFHRLTKANEVADLTKVLEDLKRLEDRYTLILHDRSKEDVSLDNSDEIYDEWVPQRSSVEHLQQRFEEAFRNEKLRRPFEWVKSNSEFVPAEYRVVPDGDFVIFDETLRQATKDKISLLNECLRSEGSLVCVYLAGPPGSGKSFFVKEVRKALSYDGPCPITSLSGVKNEEYVNALHQHITKILMSRARMALLDEVDTIARDDTAFRYLMDPMTGKLMNPWGVEDQDLTISNLIWFFAGSAGSSRQEVIRRLEGYQRKIVDFFDRIAFDFELPGAESRMEAMLIAVYWLLQNFPKLQTIHAKVFLALAVTDWNSMRQIITTLKLSSIGLDTNTSQLQLQHLRYTTSVPVFDAACRDISAMSDTSVDKVIHIRLA